MHNFENNLNTPSTEEFNLEEETLEAIAEGRALPTPEFLAENTEAKLALLRAFEEATNIKEGLLELEPEQRERFVQILSEALENNEVPAGTLFMHGILALGANQVLYDAAQNTTSYPMEGLYLAGAVAASAVAICKFWKMYQSANPKVSDSDRLKNHLKEVIAT